MALLTLLKIKGQKQGEILGSVTRKSNAGWIAVIGTSHEIKSARDPQSGLPTGKRQHKPFVFTKELDRATPALYNALCSNENLTEVEFQFFQLSPNGGEIQHYTVRLTNANIISINSVKPNLSLSEYANRNEFEEIALMYQKIQWTWVASGISAEDDWEA